METGLSAKRGKVVFKATKTCCEGYIIVYTAKCSYMKLLLTLLTSV